MKASAQEVHLSYDEIGPIQVMDDGHKRYLAFGTDDEQSCQLIHQPHLLQHEYTRAILLSLLMVTPKHVTVIGTGGGCLLTTLYHILPDCQLQGVELRAKVARLAYKYFQLPKSDRIKLHIGDGFQYLLDTDSSNSDLIIADMYLADGIDQQQLSQQFIAACYKKLNDNGWLVLNYWLDHKVEGQLVATLQACFDQIYMCDTGGGNWVIYAGKVDIHKPIIQEHKLKSISDAAGFSLNHFLRRLVVLT
ncbi:MAG: precorrin-6B methylase 2 [Oleispira sp.]|jgi:precorrin-6B methylase 2